MSAGVIAASRVLAALEASYTWAVQGGTSFTIPGTAIVGQVAMALISGGSPANVMPTTPSGWESLMQGGTMQVVWKRLAAGDIGATISPTNCDGVVAVGYSDAGDPVSSYMTNTPTGDNFGLALPALNELHPASKLVRAIRAASNWDPTVTSMTPANLRVSRRASTYWGLAFGDQDADASGDVPSAQAVFQASSEVLWGHIELPPVGYSVTPPAVRGSNIQTLYAGSINYPIPAGSVAGDEMYLFSEHAYYPTDPSGWNRIYNGSGGSYAIGGVWWKVLTAGDISTGYVTINWSGGYAGVVGAITFVGKTGGLRGIAGRQTGPGSGTMTYFSTKSTDMVVTWVSERANATQTADHGTSLQSTTSGEASARLYVDDLSSDGPYTVNVTHPGGGYAFDWMLVVRGRINGS